MTISFNVRHTISLYPSLFRSPTYKSLGFVPVDFPARYFRTSKILDYIRFYPDKSGSDGWRDWWPDPLIPFENGAQSNIEAENTQPVWFDLYIPENASPGL